ncbi:hypothetical protein RJT34_13498 [Clitoria ternatea]|uniref:Uncharacterized protein n=1 Tax=Clitoria ternatea TaxID=43366 RepID=A0AAN9JQR6_CLITE
MNNLFSFRRYNIRSLIFVFNVGVHFFTMRPFQFSTELCCMNNEVESFAQWVGTLTFILYLFPFINVVTNNIWDSIYASEILLVAYMILLSYLFAK